MADVGIIEKELRSRRADALEDAVACSCVGCGLIWYFFRYDSLSLAAIGIGYGLKECFLDIMEEGTCED